MQNVFARTDLAEESSARLNKVYSGLITEEKIIDNCKVSEVRITDSEAANAVGKPVGRYFTLQMDDYVKRSENSFSDCANAMSTILNSIDAVKNANSYLVACLGNRLITPDSVGPCTADKLIVTRHLKESLPEAFASFSTVSVLRTGVLGTTGIESADTLKAIVAAVRPDCVIAVDALASAEFERLCRNVQICDTGISPGSGVGNNRDAINKDTLGVPVIAIGVPTVIDGSALSENKNAETMFVTPRNIDELVGSISKLIAYGINLALHEGLTISDIDLLVE